MVSAVVFCADFPGVSREKQNSNCVREKYLFCEAVDNLASVSGACSVMSDSFLYSGDDAEMMSELQCCCVAVRECSGISSEIEAGLSMGTSLELAPECGLTYPQKCTC